MAGGAVAVVCAFCMYHACTPAAAWPCDAPFHALPWWWLLFVYYECLFAYDFIISLSQSFCGVCVVVGTSCNGYGSANVRHLYSMFCPTCIATCKFCSQAAGEQSKDMGRASAVATRQDLAAGPQARYARAQLSGADLRFGAAACLVVCTRPV